MWVLLGPGDAALVPSPSYPIHLAGPGFAGATVITVPMVDPGASSNDPGDDFFDGLVAAWDGADVKPRVIVVSFPAQPDERVRGPSVHDPAR
jgi:alanine-synthesizing transaminase